MYPTIGVEDYRYIFEHSEAKAVFAGDKTILSKAVEATKGTELANAIYTFDSIAGQKHWEEVRDLGASQGDREAFAKASAQIGEDDLFTIIYTSGTTGRPKGVMLSHRNLVTNVIGVSKRVPLERGQCRSLSFLPLCHVYERTGVYMYLYTGTSIYYAESMDTIADNLKEINPRTFNTVPRLLEKVYDKIIAKGHAQKPLTKKIFFWAIDLGLQYDPNKSQGLWYDMQMAIARKLVFSKWQEALGGNVQYISTGAAALQPRLARIFWAAGIRILEGYGLTETSPVITATIATPEDVRIGAVGPVIDGVEVKIAEDGEILCKGPNVMMGYYKDPEQTAQVIKDGWFHTGDIGILLEGKFLKITDRKKEMFKTSGGKYVAPQAVENRFKESDLIEQIAVIGENQKYPAALIVPSYDALQSWCEREGIPYGSPEQAIKNPQVLAKFQSEVDYLNKPFGQWEQVKKFTLMPKVWSVETGELTPTLKLKRRIIDKMYEKEIAAMFS
jgi:long-chain acyl-CoA synthetase